MGEALADTDPGGEIAALARQLARVAEPVHTVAYYCDEIHQLRDDGFRGWWHAYMAYRPAPMGAVSAATVVATLYNFAPRMVERAVPGVWDIMSPADVIARRNELTRAALHRVLADADLEASVAAAASLGGEAVTALDTGARPLFAGHAALDWPDDPIMQTWHACTLLREHRGDGHNIVLADAEVDGVECHVLMSAHGHGNQPTLEAIRGWTGDEWQAAVERLRRRGWIAADGGYTPEGREARARIERRTDELASQPIRTLGPERASELIDHLRRMVEHLTATGTVSGTWPPPGVMKPVSG